MVLAIQAPAKLNRFLAGRVAAIATTYPDVERLKPGHEIKTHLVGNPVRPEVPKRGC